MLSVACLLGEIHTKYSVKRFTITFDPCITGYHEYVRINPLKPAADQLRRRKLFFRKNPHDGNADELRKIIESNASLRVDFGWSFESDVHYQIIMDECIEKIAPNFNENVGSMMSDMTCGWIGFVPHNSYDKELYKDMSVYSLILYNNEIIEFQTQVVDFIINHHIFRQTAIIRDEWYRFSYFKSARKDRDALARAYHEYMNAIHDICLLSTIPRDILEGHIGCHYLYEPDLFFELLEFSILKGEIDGSDGTV